MDNRLIIILLFVFMSKYSIAIKKLSLDSTTAAWSNSQLENDARFISNQDLLLTSNRFQDEDTTTYSQLLFDVARNQMIVGARDVLYRLSFDLKVREKSIWEATPSLIRMCQDKGQTEQDCRNYIMVLQTYENQLYACGTYAYNPNCSWRQMENLTVIQYDKGVGKCPFNPNANITTLMTDTGSIFVGSTTDFSGSDPAILRANVVQPSGKMIRTNQYNTKWLNNPQFVGSFEAGSFVYFVFRETAVEYINCGKVVYSRIGRVCKSDPGGDLLLKDNWTSFMKARLNCSLSGEFPFYFNEIQGITYSAEEDVLYATFTTPLNSISGSAVCAFNLTAINDAFNGPFKYQDNIDSTWKRVKSQHRDQFECRNYTLTSRYKHLTESSRYQLMDQAIQPITSQPLHYSTLERFEHISLDIISTKSAERVHLLYVSTLQNLIKKISVLPWTLEACVIEIWQPEENVNTKIHALQYLKVTESVYVGTDKALIRIPAQHCNRHVSKVTCLNSMDPYCGWNELLEACTPPPNGDPSMKYWLQNELQCPILTGPIDGGWSAWSDWSKCAKYSEKSIDDGSCLCRMRSCNNPSAKNGGAECNGMATEVSNCTVNGGWTEWSAWSACSQTCGVAVKTRRRTCGNPKPAYGGRTCVGSDRDEIYCSHLPPCPAPKQPSKDGGWGPWGAWSECSSQCGGGYRFRRRECNDPIPQNGGLQCPGCNIDYEICNSQPCLEIKKLSQWTPWLIQQINDSHNDGGYVEKRFRFACKALTSDVSSIRINVSKEETRICNSDGNCQRYNENDDEHSWTDWGPCSAPCGGGQQFRIRKCDRNNCELKAHKISRVCNTHACAPDWSAWSEFSECSAKCGIGIRRRMRVCLEKGCVGKSVEEEKCEITPCEDNVGWSKWTDWSPCSQDGFRIRTRTCEVTSSSEIDCQGDAVETSSCLPESCQGNVYSAHLMFSSLIFSCLLSALFSILCTYYCLKRQYAKNIKEIGPAPTYDTYPNQYSSLPTKDYYESRPKVKRQSSFNMGTSSKNVNTGTLTKANNMQNNNTPKVLVKTFNSCESGTMKRNSHGLNNYRATNNVDDEKF